MAQSTTGADATNGPPVSRRGRRPGKPAWVKHHIAATRAVKSAWTGYGAALRLARGGHAAESSAQAALALRNAASAVAHGIRVPLDDDPHMGDLARRVICRAGAVTTAIADLLAGGAACGKNGNTAES